RGSEGTQAAGGRRSGRRGGGGQSRLLHLQVLPASALPAGRVDGLAAADVEAAVGQGGIEDGTGERERGGDVEQERHEEEDDRRRVAAGPGPVSRCPVETNA